MVMIFTILIECRESRVLQIKNLPYSSNRMPENLEISSNSRGVTVMDSDSENGQVLTELEIKNDNIEDVEKNIKSDLNVLQNEFVKKSSNINSSLTEDLKKIKYLLADVKRLLKNIERKGNKVKIVKQYVPIMEDITDSGVLGKKSNWYLEKGLKLVSS